MQNTITTQRVSFNLIALMGVLVTIGILVGFVAGLTTAKSSSTLLTNVSVAQVQAQTNLSTLEQPQAPTSGWAYRHDSLANKWFAYHYATTFMGAVIDKTYELPSKPQGSTSQCNFDHQEPGC